MRVELPANTPVVILREDLTGDAIGEPADKQATDGRVLPILIGGPEASAIHSAMEGVIPPRPLTHDLLATVIQTLGAELQRVVITEVREHTFFAELHLRTATGEAVISCRPSDAIALAVRTGCNIFAEESLLDEAGVEPAVVQDGDDEEAILDEFRDFLDDISPDDFAS